MKCQLVASPPKHGVLYPNEREQAYQLIRSQVEQGHQAFIIYPLVEAENEKQDERQAAVQEYERLKNNVFPQFKLGLMHGRLKPAEKEAVMTASAIGNLTFWFQLRLSKSV